METLLLDVRDGVALVTLNRPERMNALNAAMKVDLGKVFLDLLPRSRQTLRCVVLTGAGERAFCAGADLHERADERVAPQPFYEGQRETHQLFSAIEECGVPVIAAVNGVAAGGGLELALCCDVRLASHGARLGLPEVKLGMIPAAGGTQRLPRVIGESRAKEMLFTSALVDAETASSIGLVNRALPLAELLPAAMGMADAISRQPTLAIRFAKRAVNAGARAGLEAGLEFERYAAAMLIDTDDRKEGMRAFVEKRTPAFRGS